MPLVRNILLAKRGSIVASLFGWAGVIVTSARQLFAFSCIDQ